MVKTLNNNVGKKEKSAEKRKRRENTAKAREHARRYIVPLLVLFFSLLAGFLIVRFGMGTKLTAEELAKIRNQRQITKLMREQGTDITKLREMIGDMKKSPEKEQQQEQEINEEIKEEDEAVIE